MTLSIRAGTACDLAALTQIYNHYVQHDVATFDDEPFTPSQRAAWLHEHLGDGPHRLLVASSDEVVLGYATSSRFREKPGYASTVETSVYLAPGEGGRGLGTALYRDLLSILDALEIHRVVAGIALPNPASLALHARLGFVPVGVYTQVGRKLGRYVDVGWFERHHPGHGPAPT